MEEYVEACATCTQSRTGRQLPMGLLEPLPIPQRPWSHMAIDLVAINRFSKACRLVLLKGLPTAMETATCSIRYSEDTVFQRTEYQIGAPSLPLLSEGCSLTT